MNIVMLQSEHDLLRNMIGAEPTPACHKLFRAVRERMLRVGQSSMLSKEALAIISVLSSAVDQAEPEADHEIPEPSSSAVDLPPIEDVTSADRDEIEARYKHNGNGDAKTYTGPRIKWETKFKSTPDTPINKLEKGRPITYVSQRDGVRYPGRFVRINAKDKRTANIQSCEMKKVFSVPVSSIEVTDLSPPSPVPLAVQL